jgi:hypothetical protein
LVLSGMQNRTFGPIRQPSIGLLFPGARGTRCFGAQIPSLREQSGGNAERPWAAGMLPNGRTDGESDVAVAQAGAGCGVGVGYGWGAGITVKPAAVAALQRALRDSAGMRSQ